MSAYRQHAPSADDRETAALHDFRRRVALPILLAATLFSWFGMAVHALGYWSVIGRLSNHYYFVSAFTLLTAGAMCAAPVVVPGVVLYVALRARLRGRWREEHRRQGVSAWLETNSRRYA